MEFNWRLPSLTRQRAPRIYSFLDLVSEYAALCRLDATKWKAHGISSRPISVDEVWPTYGNGDYQTVQFWCCCYMTQKTRIEASQWNRTLANFVSWKLKVAYCFTITVFDWPDLDSRRSRSNKSRFINSKLECWINNQFGNVPRGSISTGGAHRL